MRGSDAARLVDAGSETRSWASAPGRRTGPRGHGARAGRRRAAKGCHVLAPARQGQAAGREGRSHCAGRLCPPPNFPPAPTPGDRYGSGDCSRFRAPAATCAARRLGWAQPCLGRPLGSAGLTASRGDPVCPAGRGSVTFHGLLQRILIAVHGRGRWAPWRGVRALPAAGGSPCLPPRARGATGSAHPGRGVCAGARLAPLCYRAADPLTSPRQGRGRCLTDSSLQRPARQAGTPAPRSQPGPPATPTTRRWAPRQGETHPHNARRQAPASTPSQRGSQQNQQPPMFHNGTSGQWCSYPWEYTEIFQRVHQLI
ncbi:translation initiation factor IF-2-like isoform X2 [Trachemys scripta elegans]|uniref:translation initiation factor IF-2-like isoform X2 n=1 Tax=Trachemys scripta elegans TaxID=31138 RepID=UPI0015559C96|nr:translation initiation factor IF-2-like isoform X2 [Trachemys scripta elegans]